VVRVRDFGQDWAALEQSRTPCAVVVMAHLTVREVREGVARQQGKLRLMRGLYEQRESREASLPCAALTPRGLSPAPVTVRPGVLRAVGLAGA
jgi:hypothetical protein